MARTIVNGLRIVACALILVAVFLPLYTVPVSWNGGVQATHVWDLVRSEKGSSGLIVLAFFGPLLVVGVHGLRLSGVWRTILILAQLAVLAVSVIMLSAVAHSAFGLLPVFGPWLFIPVSGSTGIGIWLTMAAVGLLLVLWLISAVGQ
ncbi:MAG: hypothetical protein JSW03_00905, partial [Candidatus Eiseniibacteriota bacterium]